MKLILQQFLHNFALKYSHHQNRFPFLFFRFRNKALQIRVFGLAVKGKLVTADTIVIYLQNRTKIVCKSIVYTIHSDIFIESIDCKIGTFPLRFQHCSITFGDSISFTFQSIHIGSFVSIMRYDRESNIQFLLQQPYKIQIPEVRIHTRPPVSLLQSWKQSFKRWIPNEKSDEPLPQIHLSSIFIRYHSWTKCIAPISTGTKSIWELYEHVVRAIIRI